MIPPPEHPSPLHPFLIFCILMSKVCCNAATSHIIQSVLHFKKGFPSLPAELINCLNFLKPIFYSAF
uniref:Uncharacterized protein n=1 Tax=Octopus bimaculoides TaxID=37653 RepID=A0A0L8HKN5_OCTBM